MDVLLLPSFVSFADWTNKNQGIVSVAIFAITLIVGWTSGIFGALIGALKRKPKFNLELIPGPSFVCTFGIGKKYEEYDVHRTGVALYIRISNIGSAPASIKDVHIGYHWCVKPFSMNWLRYRIGWFWLKEQTVIPEDFQADIGKSNIKFYPFLTQKSTITGDAADSYLKVGMTTNGVTYFEQSDSWGGCFPNAINNRVLILVKVVDSFGKAHRKKFHVPKLNLEGARLYNPSFGATLAALYDESEQHDLDVDENGNAFPPTV